MFHEILEWVTMKKMGVVLLGYMLFWLTSFIVELIPFFSVFGNKISSRYIIYPIPLIVLFALELKRRNRDNMEKTNKS